MKKLFVSFSLLLFIISFHSGVLEASTTNPASDFSYTNTGTSITITGFVGIKSGSLNIPSTIDDLPVTRIADYAFRSCIGFTGALTIPDSVTAIGTSAFANCNIEDYTISNSKISFSNGNTFTYGSTKPTLRLTESSYDAFSSQTAVNTIFNGAKITICIPANFDSTQCGYLQSLTNATIVSPDNAINVNFDSNGGSSVVMKTTNRNTEITSPSSPTRSGYAFSGWYTAAIGGTHVSFPHTFASSTTLYAHWIQLLTTKTFTVDYNSSSDPSKYYKISANTGVLNFYNISGNSDKVTVVFKNAKYLTVYSREFTRSIDNSGSCSLSGVADGEYYLWLSEINAPSANIKINVVNENATFVLPIYYDNKVLALVATERTDSYALNFYKKAEDNIESDDSTIIAQAKKIIENSTSDLDKIKAIHDWVANNVWYDYDFFEGRTGSTYLSAVDILKNKRTVCQGYANLSTALYRAAGFSAKVVYGRGAFWDSNINETSNYAPNHAWTEVFYNGRWITTDCTWDSLNSYRNGAFSDQESCNSYYLDPTMEIFTRDHYMVNNGDENVTYYKVTFNSNGGSVVLPIENLEVDSKITKPTDPQKTGYSFDGWYKDLTTAWNFDTDKVTANTTLYAKWTIISYEITFDTNEGSSITSNTAKYNTRITRPATPIKAGYTFVGWYKDRSLTTAWNFSTDKVTADTTLYAKWETATYRVTFNTNGGSAISAQIFENIIAITAPTAPTKAGYTFAGWYKNSMLTTAWNFETDLVTANVTLYAKWAINTFTVTFESNGGSTVTPKTVNYNTSITAPTAPTKAGYKFAGWYTAVSGGTIVTFPFTIKENRTLYAHWKAITTPTQTPTPTPSTVTTVKAPSSVKVKTAKKSARLTWKSVSNCGGYEVYRATSSKGSYSKVTTIKKRSTVSYTAKKLKAGKKYYFKIRAYKTVNGKKVYSKFSKIVNVKVK